MYVRSRSAPLDSNGRPNRAKLASGHELLVIRLLASTIIEVLSWAGWQGMPILDDDDDDEVLVHAGRLRPKAEGR